MGFGKLNDNMIKGLINLLSVEQDIESIAYTCGLCIITSIFKAQQAGKLDDIPHSVEMKAKIVYCCIRGLWKQSSSSKRQ